MKTFDQMTDQEFRLYLDVWARTRDEILAGLAGDPVAIANNRREVNRLRHVEEEGGE
jgi:hypothetical protein